MANQIKLNFSLEKNNGFVLRITERGQTNGSRATVKGLINPDFKRWDKKEQRFNDATQEAIHNNNVLLEMKRQYQYFIDNADPQTPAQLKQMVIAGKCVQASAPLTLGCYLQRLIEEMKTTKVLMPSKNYQCYITLLHKLEEEKKLIHTPLNEIDDIHFIAFGQFILNQLQGVNYMGLMKRFHATMERARQAKLTSNILEHRYKKDKPRNSQKALTQALKGVDTLTIKQYEIFCKMDLTTIPCGNKTQVKHMELYRDFCILLYELKMRPCDVVKLHKDNIAENNVVYWVTKKKNYSEEQTMLTTTPLTPIAKNIIAKYAGQSPNGYIFPFAMNKYDWDLKNASSFGKWHNKKQYTLERVNAFLKKVATGLEVDKLTIYTFRHSTFTHQIQQGANPIQLAKEGGTTVAMIEKHYYNHIKK